MRIPILMAGAVCTCVTVTAQHAAPADPKLKNLAGLAASRFEQQFTGLEQPNYDLKKKDEPATIHGPTLPPQLAARSAAPAPGQWQVITQSMNANGVLLSNAKPLNYHEKLNTVSFVHRKGPDYLPNPFPTSSSAESGAIVSVFSTDWGFTWDTTLLWNSNDYHGRYPQGAIYSPEGNMCLSKAWMVASGAVTQQTGGWLGSFLASKKLYEIGDTNNSNRVSLNTADHMFVANTGPFPHGKFDTPSTDFVVTGDGVVRSLGYLVDDVNATGSAFGWKGASIVTGQFSAGSFLWSSDTIIPEVYTSPGGTLHVSGQPHMCWNEAGTVGYVWFVGVRKPRPGQGDTLSNMGFQPIIYKTTNSGASWTEMPRMNFNDNAGGVWNTVFSQMFSVFNDSLGIPFFNVSEGVDGIVDRNDRLHIVSTVVGTASKQHDSLGFTFLINNSDGQRYNYAHIPGLRPFIFDFTETSQGWKVTRLDSMSSEAPGTRPLTDGYESNPWNEVNGRKIDTEARLQLSRSSDGRYIIYTWAETDTGFTFQNRKWNVSPNVIARMAEIGVETGTAVAGMTLHPQRINITSPSSTLHPPYTKHTKVQDRAFNFYVSPKAAIVSNTASSGVALALPVTVSNNDLPLRSDATVDHYFLPANLNFDNVTTSFAAYTASCSGVGVREHDLLQTAVYPNPANDVLQIDAALASGPLAVQVFNTLGQQVAAPAQTGERGRVTCYLGQLPDGVYLISVSDGKSSSMTRVVKQ